ncbi:hypothetical protein SADUNF_Sadunf10G0021800 [Salix dunnii]|uniref:Uncharacterized protein n=1 Tax=Salix dunnii TaxID=1413687 RepID=A0A835MR41_9ROSI|nr:hypothetical protein SADUNF_Sadunf10G0021800 [Salix dunnii]
MAPTNFPKHARQHHAIHPGNHWEATNEHSQVVGYEKAPEARVKAAQLVVSDENVDDEAEEFIKLEHRKFALRDWMSQNGFSFSLLSCFPF